MDSRADMRSVTTILLSEDPSPMGRVDIATWAIGPEGPAVRAAPGV